MTPAERRERALVDWIFEREGSAYTNHKHDLGGSTRFGVTARALGEWAGLGREATGAEVAALDEAGARAFYRDRYVLLPSLRLDLLEPLGAALTVIDTAVLFGAGRAAVWAQESAGAGLRRDGVLGPASRAAILAVPPMLFVARMQARRIDRHVDRCVERPSQLVFLKGWARRTVNLTSALAVPDGEGG